MKTLILKELQEHALHLTMMILAGVGSLFMLSWFKQLDNETVLSLLFLFEAPLFTVMLAGHLVSSEVESGTFPFLAGIPISRFGIWAAKAVAGLLLCLVIYGAFLGIAHLAGVSEFILDFGLGDFPKVAAGWFSSSDIPLLTPVLLVFGFPAVIFAAGYWGTMLPKKLPILEAIAGGIAVWILWARHIFSAMNIPLALTMVCGSFMISSWITFRQGGLMTSWKRAFWAVGSLVLCLIVCLFAWFGLDRLADSRQPEWRMESGPQMLGDGRSFLMGVRTPSEWFDPLQGMGDKIWSHRDPDAGDTVRCIQYDAKTRKYAQIWRRGLVEPLVSRDGRWMAAVSVSQCPGIRTTPRMILTDVNSWESRVTVDWNSRPMEFLKDGRLLYERFTAVSDLAVSTEVCIYEPGSGTRSLFATIDDRPIALAPVCLDCIKSVLIRPLFEKNSLLVDLSTGRVSSATYLDDASCLYQDEKLAIFFPKNQSSFRLLENGKQVRTLDRIATETRFLGRMYDGRLIAVMTATSSIDGMSLPSQLLAEYEPESGTTRPLENFRNVRLNACMAQISGSGKKILISPTSPKQGEAGIVDLATGKETPIPLPSSSICDFRPFDRDRITVFFDSEVWSVETERGAVEKVASFPEMLWHGARRTVY